MVENTLIHYFFLPFGVLVGAYGALVGAGGGFLIVPVLLWTSTTPQEAIGTSLLVVFFNAFSGSLSYARKRRIDYHTGLRFSVWILPGAIGGVFLATLFSRKMFSLIFGLLLLVLAVVMIIRPTLSSGGNLGSAGAERAWWKRKTFREMPNGNGEKLSYSYHTAGGYAMSFFIGFFSSLLGIGGGIIHVPVMIHFLNFPAHVATATSLFILTISAGIGAFMHLLLGHVLPKAALLIGAGAIIGAQLGARLAQHIHGSVLARFLAFGLLAVGLKLLFS